MNMLGGVGGEGGARFGGLEHDCVGSSAIAGEMGALCSRAPSFLLNASSYWLFRLGSRKRPATISTHMASQGYPL